MRISDKVEIRNTDNSQVLDFHGQTGIIIDYDKKEKLWVVEFTQPVLFIVNSRLLSVEVAGFPTENIMLIQ